MSASVLVSLRIRTTPERAFSLFVDDIASWWVPDPLFQITLRGDGRLQFEPGPEGRLVTTLPNGKTFEIGRILDWSPPDRLAFSWRQATFAPDMETRVEVQFEEVRDATRVTVKHSGWTKIPQAHAARHGFPDEMTQRRAGAWWLRSLDQLAART